MKLRLNKMAAGLTLGVTAAVMVACGLGAWLYSLHHFDTLMEMTRRSSLAQSELIRTALEHQMMENDRTLIARMIESFGRQPGVSAVVLLDRTGHARYSSAPLASRTDLEIGSPTCQACHRFPPAQRMNSRVISTAGGTVLRTVVPFMNREACHTCHDPSQRINGVLILDSDAGAIKATMNRDLRWMALGIGLIMLLLIAAIGLVVRVAVMRRLQRFETTARLIAGGDLERRVPVGGSDTIDWLAQEFNVMADSMATLVSDVRRERERLERVINSIDDGIVVLSPDRKVIAANDAFLRRAGRERGGVLGSPCRHVTQGMCGTGDCPTLACLESGQHQVRLCERRAGDDGVAWEEVHSSPILGPTGRIEQVVEVWRDISRRRAAEAQLAESHRLASLGLLASGFSHELNTPLATVLACLEGILKDTRPEEAAAPEALARIEESARLAREQLMRCRGITQHFLRLSSGKASPTDIVDVGASLDAASRLIQPTARAHAVTIEAAPVPAGLHVRVNDAELQQILLNLLLNGVQACRPGGRVRLEVVPGDPVRILVADDGCGIAPAQQQKIFEPFFSLRQGGTGLGLFLSLNFARRWGGDILARSVPGEGATFEIRLPAAERAAAARGVA